MAEDLNNDQSVTDQDLEAGVVDQQDLNTADSVDQQDVLADGTPKDKTVKYSELEKAVQAKRAAEEQAAYAQRQLELYAQNQQPVRSEVPLTIEQQALKDLGITEDDLWGKNVVDYTSRVNQLASQQTQQSQATMAAQQFAISHPDINSVVGSVNPATGQIMTVSPELLAVLNKKPYLREACTSLANAYQIVMDERAISNTQSPAERQAEAQRKADIATAPLGGSAAGGAGGGGANQSQNLLTREQMAEIDAKIARGEY